MKKTYSAPQVNVIAVSADDMMTGSDTIVDVGGLFGEEEIR